MRDFNIEMSLLSIRVQENRGSGHDVLEPVLVLKYPNSTPCLSGNGEVWSAGDNVPTSKGWSSTCERGWRRPVPRRSGARIEW